MKLVHREGEGPFRAVGGLWEQRGSVMREPNVHTTQHEL